MNYRIVLQLVLSLVPLLCGAEELIYRYAPGSKQKIEAAITGRQVFKDLQGNPFQSTDYQQEYKTVRTITDTVKGSGVIEDHTYYYNQNINAGMVAKEITDTRVVSYVKDQYGRMIVKKSNIFPTLRNTPAFPDYEVTVGDTWVLSGIEVQDLFNDGEISYFPFMVTYTFEGYTFREDEKLARIRYEYELNTSNEEYNNIDPRIRKAIGKSKTILLFDMENGVQVEENYERHYQFLLQTNEGAYIAEFIDQGKTYLVSC
jgi:hypothetical protein